MNLLVSQVITNEISPSLTAQFFFLKQMLVTFIVMKLEKMELDAVCTSLRFFKCALFYLWLFPVLDVLYKSPAVELLQKLCR